MLSLLWRVIISKSFNTPEVDEKIVEQFRLSVHYQNPLDFDDFSCLLQIVMYKKEQIASCFILHPFLTKNKNSPILNILIDGFMFSFYRNSKHIPKDKKEFFLKKDRTIIILGKVPFFDHGLLE